MISAKIGQYIFNSIQFKTTSNRKESRWFLSSYNDHHFLAMKRKTNEDEDDRNNNLLTDFYSRK